ncbi:MAG: bifunctional glutamate N-acetyltransferase/amino-acid acetyltransferase ArgJ [Anaerolineae bacterium]
MTADAITRVPGFKAAGVTCGLKDSGNKDLALIVSDRPCVWGAVFTTNVFRAAPVLYDEALLARTGGQGLQGVVINAGRANACTGERGLRDAEQMARRAEAAAGLPPNSVCVMSTGLIGAPLPMDKVEAGIKQAVRVLSADGGAAAAEAIMTTDTVPKGAFARFTAGGRRISIGAIAKGSGMIHPNLATMLAVIATDAPLSAAGLNAALRRAVSVSFNRLSVDGDTSTNDTVAALASGGAGDAPLDGPELEQFSTVLTGVCVELAKAIARDGEGATKLVEIRVRGARTEAAAAAAAAAIATSPLSKTALFGNDPNWGRFLAAVGRSGATIDPHQTALWLKTPAAQVQLVGGGQPLSFDAPALSRAMGNAAEVSITVHLGVGSAEAVYWTCDLSYKYVEINAEYHT